jgi:hypothetical protein
MASQNLKTHTHLDASLNPHRPLSGLRLSETALYILRSTNRIAAVCSTNAATSSGLSVA